MQNVLYMSQASKDAFEKVNHLLAGLEQGPEQTTRNKKVFETRLERYWVDFYESFSRLYGQHPQFENQIESLARLLAEHYALRPADLKELDYEREITPDWFQRESQVGGIYYVDLFAGNLQGVREHLDYARELGLTYLHLMPLLKPRPGQNDGGYAVEDYCEVNPQLGTMQDLAALASDMRAKGMSLCIDLVVNHTAKEHEWARRAMAGEPRYLDYYLTFDDHTLPDEYEKTLPEVFPEFKQGNFTFYPQMAGTGKWVWTTFNEYQWDLNYTNPAVFREMLNYMLFLANRGVDVLRLDAVPFMWKRLGTHSQNQPEVHDLLQAFRALVRVVAPALIFKAEAIVPPQELIAYLGTDRHAGKECDIAYNNSLMVTGWSALASQKVNIMTQTLKEMPPPPSNTTWITYVRCHDDIGWAITDENAGAVGENAYLHRQFLNQFYSGQFLGSYSRGEIFQFNPQTGDGRMNGMAASLAGLEKALETGDEAAAELALARVMLLYSIAFSYGGIPLIYMGDEIGLLNDYGYLKNPDKAADSRWMHRPPMDWAKAARRHDPTSWEGRFWAGMRELVEARRRLRPLHGTGLVEAQWTDNEHVFAYARQHPSGHFLALCNFSPLPQSVNAAIIRGQGWSGELHDVRRADHPALYIWDNRVMLEPYRAIWLVREL